MPQVSDADVQNFNRLNNLERDFLNKDPKIRNEFLRLYKKLYPEAPVPELDRAAEIEQMVESRTKALEDEIKEIRRTTIQRDAQEASARQRERLTRAPFNLAPSEIDEVIQYQANAQTEGQLLSLETAARAWIQERQIPSGHSKPRLPFSTKGNRPKNDFRKALRDPKSELFTNTRDYVKKEADEAREELREAFGEVLI